MRTVQIWTSICFQIPVKCATSKDINEMIKKCISSRICLLNLLAIKRLGERLSNEACIFSKGFLSQIKMRRFYISALCYLVD